MNVNLEGVEVMLSHWTTTEATETAIRWATLAHEGQLDKQGQPYVLHVLRVGLAGKTQDERVVGFLHDVLEDTQFPPKVLRQAFGVKVGEALDAITRKEREVYTDYILRVKANPIARAVKINDLQDNLSRIAGLKPEEQDVLKERYTRALEFLLKNS